MFAIMHVFTFPPRESCRRRVSFESRYGTCLLLPSTKLVITFIKAERERLILVASRNRTPVEPVRFYFSDPARSTKLSLPIRIVCSFLLLVTCPKKRWNKINYVGSSTYSCVHSRLHEDSEDAVGARGVSIHQSFPRGLVLVPLCQGLDKLVHVVADADLAILHFDPLLGLFYLKSFLYHVSGCT